MPIITAEDKIIFARTQFLFNLPFLGELSLRLALKQDPSINTMATDMRYIYYNPEQVGHWSLAEVTGVVAHEVWHCVFGHAGEEGKRRMGERNGAVWEAACEYRVNYMVLKHTDLGKGTIAPQLPGKPYFNEKYDEKWTTEEIYADLMKNTIQIKCVVVDDHSKWGAAGGGSKKGSDEGLSEKWKMWVAKAAQSAKTKGDLPLGIERAVQDILDPQLPWQTIMSEFAVSFAMDDYSWDVPDKRYLHRKLVLPSLHSTKVVFGFAMDTSGSMSEEDLSEGLAEFRGALRALPSYEVHIFACDAALHHYQVCGPYDEPDIKGLVRGGGGTDFRPVFKKIEDDDIHLDALIYFTDAMGDFPDKQPDYPVLWVVKGKHEVPWGRVIRMSS